MREYRLKTCDLCGKNPATRREIVLINYVPHEVDICEDCFQKLQMQQSGYQNADMYNVFGGMTDPECPICHTKLSEIIDSEYVGCSECYNMFRSEVLNNIYKMHGTRKHIGKRLRSVKKNKNVKLSDRENLTEQYHLAKDEGRLDDAEELFSFLTEEDNRND